MTIGYIAGGIGAGKSTLIANLAKNQQFYVAPEPIETFEKCKILELLYGDIKKYAFHAQSFFNVVMHTYASTLIKEKKERPIIMERSHICSEEVFTLAYKHMGILNQEEVDILKTMRKTLDKLNPVNFDFVLYLRTSPEECLKRIKARNRESESKLDLNYVKLINEHYDCSLIYPGWELTNTFVLDGNKSESEIVSDALNVLSEFK